MNPPVTFYLAALALPIVAAVLHFATLYGYKGVGCNEARHQAIRVGAIMAFIMAMVSSCQFLATHSPS